MTHRRLFTRDARQSRANKHKPAHAVPVSSKRPPRPKPKGSGQLIKTRGSLANERTVEGAVFFFKSNIFLFGRALRDGDAGGCARLRDGDAGGCARLSVRSAFVRTFALPTSLAFVRCSVRYKKPR